MFLELESANRRIPTHLTLIRLVQTLRVMLHDLRVPINHATAFISASEFELFDFLLDQAWEGPLRKRCTSFGAAIRIRGDTLRAECCSTVLATSLQVFQNVVA